MVLNALLQIFANCVTYFNLLYKISVITYLLHYRSYLIWSFKCALESFLKISALVFMVTYVTISWPFTKMQTTLWTLASLYSVFFNFFLTKAIFFHRKNSTAHRRLRKVKAKSIICYDNKDRLLWSCGPLVNISKIMHESLRRTHPMFHLLFTVISSRQWNISYFP